LKKRTKKLLKIYAGVVSQPRHNFLRDSLTFINGERARDAPAYDRRFELLLIAAFHAAGLRSTKWRIEGPSQVLLGGTVSFAHSEVMFETFTYDKPEILPQNPRNYWEFMETNSAAAVLHAVCPEEWRDIVHVLATYRLNSGAWLKAGGNRGDIASQIDAEFGKLGWCEARLDLETRGFLYSKEHKEIGVLPPVRQEGYLVDNFKGRVVLDVEWNAKDGNLDRDLAAYRSWYEAGVISAGVIITKDRPSLLNLARRIWNEYQALLPVDERNRRLPIDLMTSTTTGFDKAQMRLRRGVMGTCPVLIIAASDKTWDGSPYR
jgi:hypothetical protein